MSKGDFYSLYVEYPDKSQHFAQYHVAPDCTPAEIVLDVKERFDADVIWMIRLPTPNNMEGIEEYDE